MEIFGLGPVNQVGTRKSPSRAFQKGTETRLFVLVKQQLASCRTSVSSEIRGVDIHRQPHR